MKYTFLFILMISIFLSEAQIDKSHLQLIQREQNSASLQMRQVQGAINNYDIVYQKLFLTPNLNQDYIEGTVTTHYIAEPTTTSPMSLQFDMANQLQVQSIIYHGNSLNFNHTNDILEVYLPPSAQSGVLDSLSVHYSGTPPDSGFDSYVTTTHNNVPVVWTLSEPYGARDWWPCKQDLNDKIDTLEVTINYPRYINGHEMKAVSNGVLTQETISNNSIDNTEYKQTTWHSNYPIAAYLVAFAVTDYTQYTLTAGIQQNFPIDNFFYPEDASFNQQQTQQIVPVMNVFEQKFGLYPFRDEKYGQVQFGWGGGMEHQTATFLVNYGRQLMAHELGHQWFGDAVTCGSWHDIWLNEGFATYTEGITVENLDGNQDFINWKQNKINFVTSQPAGSVYVQDTTDVSRIFNGRLSYAKGGMVLNMLRKKLGDTDFFQGLKNYVNQKMFDYAVTDDFKNIMETTSGQSLDEFFNDWIYGQGYPIYNIQVVRSGIHHYQITIHQTQSHPSVSFFEMSLPFRFSSSNGQTFDVMIDNTFDGQIFDIDVGFDAVQVAFDPESDIITKNPIINANLSVETLQSAGFKLYPVPASGIIYLKNTENVSIDKIEIYSLSGSLIKTFEDSFNQLDIHGIASGLYILKLHTPGRMLISKIAIKP